MQCSYAREDSPKEIAQAHDADRAIARAAPRWFPHPSASYGLAEDTKRLQSPAGSTQLAAEQNPKATAARLDAGQFSRLGTQLPAPGQGHGRVPDPGISGDDFMP